MSTVRDHVARSTLGNTVAKIASLGTWFVVTPFIVERLGFDAFALWAALTSIFAFSAQVDYALGTALVRDVASHATRDDLDRVRAITATAWALAAAYAIVLSCVALLAISALRSRLPSIGGDPDLAAHTALLMVVNAIASLAFVSTSSVLRGLQRFDLANVATLLAGSATAVSAVAALAGGGGLRSMVTATSGAMWAVVLVTLMLIARAEPRLSIRWGSADRSLLPAIASFSFPLLFRSLATQLQTKTGELLIAGLLPLGSVTPFHLARRLSEIPQFLTDQFVRVILPLTAELEATADRDRLRRVYLAASRLSFASLVSTGLVLTLLARPLLVAWVGPAFAPFAPVVVILVTTALLESSQWVAYAVLQGIGRHRAPAIASAASGIASIALGVLLAPRFGVVGVACGLLAPTAIVATTFVVPFATRSLALPMRSLWRSAVLPALIPAVPAAALILLLLRSFEHPSWIVVGMTAMIGGLAYIFVYLVFGAETWERRAYREIVGRAVPVFRLR